VADVGIAVVDCQGPLEQEPCIGYVSLGLFVECPGLPEVDAIGAVGRSGVKCPACRADGFGLGYGEGCGVGVVSMVGCGVGVIDEDGIVIE